MFGLYAPGHEVSRLSYFALYALQHRGQESAGIAAADRGGHIITRRELGARQPGVQRERPAHARGRAGDRSRALLDHRLQRLGELPAGAALRGHRRLAARGRARAQRQPDQRRGAAGASCSSAGVTFSSTSDSEIIAALIATHPAESIEDAIADVLPRLRGAFSIVAMTKDRGGRLPRPARAAPAGARRARSARPRARAADGSGVRPARPATASPASPARSTSSARSSCARCSPGEMVTLGEHGLQSRMVARRAAARVLRVRVHLLRPPRLAHERPGAAGRRAGGWARSCGARRRSRPIS